MRSCPPPSQAHATGSSEPMENSPPGIQTMPSGAGPGAGAVTAIVGPKGAAAGAGVGEVLPGSFADRFQRPYPVKLAAMAVPRIHGQRVREGRGTGFDFDMLDLRMERPGRN